MRPVATNGRWKGLEVLEKSPIGTAAGDLALYSELWSKLRWAIGTTLQMDYGKRSLAGELGRRCALVVLANKAGPQLL